MSSSDQPLPSHDPRSELDRLDAVTLMALGEPPPEHLHEHIQGCAACLADVITLRRTIELGRAGAGDHDDPGEPAGRVWDRIADQLHLSPSAGGQAPLRFIAAPGRWRRRALVAATIIVVAAGGITGGYAIGAHQRTATTVIATAELGPMPGGTPSVHGSAVVRGTPTGSQLSVSTSGLPLRTGFYEVWLYDPQSDVMVAVGTLARNGEGAFPVPPGLDISAFHVVDISAQDYNGNPAHGTSMLRGTFTG